ncbi:hypothetical protein FSARC_4277 [Fusarium sarcochroum]|uniref:Heterokaryon incompatibility domain-containing protein n=1 Tax=Fusarium sarcochroum TaxID=1208366 RepID=A0A8H4U1Y4_9HYPO|nr:hypothetical protein FSARC_4277 [Fusarium sarcochroum]
MLTSNVGLRAHVGGFIPLAYLAKHPVFTRFASLPNYPRPPLPIQSQISRGFYSSAKAFGVQPRRYPLIFHRQFSARAKKSPQRASGATIVFALLWILGAINVTLIAALFLHFAVYGLLRNLWARLHVEDDLHDLGQYVPSAHNVYKAYADRHRSILDERQEIARLREPQSDDSIYSKLKDDELRVLILEPGLENDEIACKLCTCKHSDLVSYQALSYAWGDPTKVKGILCNGQKVAVASNLHEALINLRHPQRARVFWIDALCINQDDFTERGQQVQKMRSIYAEARQVLVWLGQGTATSERAFQYLLEGPRISTTWEPVGFDFTTEPHKTDHYTEDLGCLRTLLERPWFRRLWVLQEVAHGRKVILMAGRQTVGWDLFARSVQRLYRSGLILDESSEKAQIGAAAVIEMESIRQSQQLSRARARRAHRGLLSVLLATHSGECSDARDRIYAVLNLADDYDTQRDTEAIGPDYNLDPREVFIRFARWCIGRGDLGILSCTTRVDERVAKGSETNDLPSWVPDWTNIEIDNPFIRYLDRIPFKADVGLQLMPHDPPRITEDNELILFGTVIDVIKEVGHSSTFRKSHTYPGGASQLVDIALTNKAWLDECRELSHIMHHDTQGNSEEPVWRTVTAGLTGEGYGIPDNFGHRFNEYTQLLGDMSRSAIQDSTGQASALIDNMFESQKQLTAMIEPSILMWASKRRFAVTEDDLMALVPNTARRGDVIVVVDGSKVPLVFRRIPDGVGRYHMVLGEAFLHGLMDGQAVKRHVEDYKRLGKGYKRLLFKDFIVI